MSGEKHSPGPWNWSRDKSDPDRQMILRDQLGVAVLDFGYDGQYDQSCGNEPGKEDARLIAAAPEMLELLREAVPCDGSEADGFWDRVRALIKRIEGEP